MALKCCFYTHLDTLESVKMFRGISDTFDVFMTSSMPDLSVILQFLAMNQWVVKPPAHKVATAPKTAGVLKELTYVTKSMH